MGNVLGKHFRVRTCSLMYEAKCNNSPISCEAFMFIETSGGIKEKPRGTPLNTFSWF